MGHGIGSRGQVRWGLTPTGSDGGRHTHRHVGDKDRHKGKAGGRVQSHKQKQAGGRVQSHKGAEQQVWDLPHRFHGGPESL